jgi:hypothetical protein
MSSLVGPLVTPNGLEDRFDRVGLVYHTTRHPVLRALAVLTVLLAIAGAGVYAHVIPLPF